MIRSLVVMVAALAVLLGLAPAASATANPPFCKGVRHCHFGGDPGVTWVTAFASSRAKANKAAARLLRNAKAVHRRYGAPRYIDIRVLKKGGCWKKYGSGTREPSRVCVLKRVERRL
ncbi:hypothetical protein ACFMQL_40760 [Nonomuraea fastidiosa]|jgi:hypothetical protein|uniref:hypothetical protein n=1 Tax=Nonomuraea TaxID=83681 RepID=UPI00324B8031